MSQAAGRAAELAAGRAALAGGRAEWAPPERGWLAISPYRPPPQRLPRLLAGLSYDRPARLRDHAQRYGPVPLRGPSGRERPERLIDVVERSGLTGRGGAGFPTSRKMRSVAAAAARR